MFYLKKIKKNTCRYHYQNLDDMIYSSWDIEQNILKLVILGHFLPFYPPKNPQNQNFEKWKILLEISSFYTCVPKISHMIHGSWDMECDRQNVLLLWTVFCPFTPLWTQKIKILKKWKKHLKISFYKCLLEMTVIWYIVFFRYGVQQAKFFCHFGPFFAL